MLFSLAVVCLLALPCKEKAGLHWTLAAVWENLDYTDDPGLPSHRHRDMKQKTEKLRTTARTIGFKVKDKKIQVLRLFQQSSSSQGEVTGGVRGFVFFGSQTTSGGDCHQEIHARISASPAKTMLCSLSPVGDPRTSKQAQPRLCYAP